MNWQSMVRDFNVKFGATVGDTPAIRDPELRAALIEEEAKETVDAIRAGDLVAAVDGLCDLIYVAVGAAVAFGVDLEPMFAEVHRTNMAKDGGATRADGKILKPHGWRPPRIAELLAEQANRITIKLPSGPRMVSAQVVGDTFAVHRSIGALEEWTISHIRTGFAVLHTYAREDAVKIATELAEMGLAAWQSDDHKMIVADLPKPVIAWIHQCRDRGAHVPFPSADAA